MAKNRQPEKTVESSEEDDDASSEEAASHDSDSEPEQTQGAKKPAPSTPTTTLKKTPPQASSKSQKQLPAASSSSSDEESGSESDSDSDGPDPQVKPIATKPMDGAQKSNLAAGKRPAEEKETEAKDSKKAKKASEPESSAKQSTNDSKKLFQRLWSEDDEIAILEGMTDYALSKNADPLADLNAFHDFIRKNLHVDVTKVQLQDKIRRLKRKYMNNKGKEKGGKVRTLSNPHEQKAYELSKNIWGNENVKEDGDDKMVVTSPRANGRAVKKTPAKGANAPETETEEVNDTKSAVVAVNADAQCSSPAARLFSNGGSLEDNILRTGEEMFALGKWVEKGKEWNKLKMEEIAIIQRHLELKSAQVKLVLDAMKSDDH